MARTKKTEQPAAPVIVNSGTVENLKAVETAGPEDILGYLVWYTVAETSITREQLERIFDMVALDKKLLPKPISPRDAFRRAVKIAEIPKTALGGGQFENILVREVRATKTELVEQVVREIVDSNNKRLEYLPVQEMTLTGEESSYNSHTMALQNTLEEKAIGGITEAFATACTHYSSRHVRDLVFDVLNTCQPVNVRPSGGVYFTPRTFGETVDNLKEFARALAPFSVGNRETRFWAIPVINGVEEKAMVEESLEDQVESESQRMINEITKLVENQGNGRTITQALAQQYIERAQNLRKLVEDYKTGLEMEAAKSETNLEVALRAARMLLTQVEVKA